MSDFDAFVKKYEPMLQAMLPEYERHKVEMDRRAAEDLAAQKAEPFDDGVTDENRAEIYAPLVAAAPELPPFVPEPEKAPEPEFRMAPEPFEAAPPAPKPPETEQAAPGAPEGESAATEEMPVFEAPPEEPPAARVEEEPSQDKTA
jgi:hypothetical protein